MKKNKLIKRTRWFLGAGLLFLIIVAIIAYPTTFLNRSIFFLLLCCLLCLIRLILGPTAPDRAVVIDILGIIVVGLCGILSIFTGRNWYIDIAIAWALQSFIGTLALAKYLEGKKFDE